MDPGTSTAYTWTGRATRGGSGTYQRPETATNRFLQNFAVQKSVHATAATIAPTSTAAAVAVAVAVTVAVAVASSSVPSAAADQSSDRPNATANCRHVVEYR